MVSVFVFVSLFADKVEVIVEVIEDKLVVEDFVMLAITRVPEAITMATTSRATKVSILLFNLGYASTMRVIEMVKLFESTEFRRCFALQNNGKGIGRLERWELKDIYSIQIDRAT